MNQFEEGDKNFQPTNVAQLQRWLPWLRMFRGFRIAIDYQKLIVALVAVMIWWSVSQLLTSFFVNEQEGMSIHSPSHNLIISPAIDFLPSNSDITNPAGELSPFESLLLQTQSISWFFENVMNSILALVSFQGFASWWHAWCQLLWGLGIATLFGGMIARMAAREFTGQSRSLIRDSKFAFRQAPVTYLSPLIALVSFAFMWSFNWICGFIGRIPVLGEIALAVFWGVFLISGLIMFLFLVGLVLGWPIMLCSGAVERNDSFDALSRAFSYLLNRPWYALFLAILAFGYGSLTLIFVSYTTKLSVFLGLSSVSAGLGEPIINPSLNLTEIGTGLFESDIAEGAMAFWLRAASLVPAAYAFSFFWSSTTIAYFLLRRREDGTPLHEIELSDSQTRKKPELAVVGIPAVNLRENDD